MLRNRVGLALVGNLFLSQQRFNGRLDGRNWHPPGQKLASQIMPVDDASIEKMANLAKIAHKEKNYADALVLYIRLADYYRQKFETHAHDDIAFVLYNAARIHLDQKNPQEATYPAEEAAAIYEQLHGPHDPKSVEAMALVAMIYKTTRTPEVAIKAFVEVLASLKGLYYNHRGGSWIPGTPVSLADPSKSPLATVAHVLADYSSLCSTNGDIRTAMELLESALEVRRYLYTSNLTFKPMIAQTLVKLAELSRHKGVLPQADVYVDEAIMICMQCGGRDAPATAQAISTKGHIHMSKKEVNLAKKCFSESVTTFAVVYGDESPLVAHELVLFGRCCQVLKEGPEAEKAFTRAHMIYLSMYGTDHLMVGDVLSHMGNLKMELGRYAEAERDLSAALTLRKKMTPGATQVSVLCHKLAELFTLMKRTEAESYFLESIAGYKLLPEAQHILATDVMDDLAWFYNSYSLHEKALEYFEEALKIRRRETGAHHPSVGYSLSNIAAVHTTRREYDKAEASALAALEVYQGCNKPTWLPLADCYQNLAQIYRNSAKPQQAIEMYDKAMYVRRMNSQQTSEPFAELLYNSAKTMSDSDLHLDVAERYIGEAIAIVLENSKNDTYLSHLYKLNAEVKHKKMKLLEAVST